MTDGRGIQRDNVQHTIVSRVMHTLVDDDIYDVKVIEACDIAIVNDANNNIGLCRWRLLLLREMFHEWQRREGRWRIAPDSSIQWCILLISYILVEQSQSITSL